jgi:hypothetical protein
VVDDDHGAVGSSARLFGAAVVTTGVVVDPLAVVGGHGSAV